MGTPQENQIEALRVEVEALRVMVERLVAFGIDTNPGLEALFSNPLGYDQLPEGHPLGHRIQPRVAELAAAGKKMSARHGGG